MSVRDFIQNLQTPASAPTEEVGVAGPAFLYGSASMKSGLEAHPEWAASFETLDLQDDTLVDDIVHAQESQQLDADLSEKVNQALMDRIKELNVPTKYNSTGRNYFLIDPTGLEEDSREEIQTLMALARASLYDPQRVIAAFVPVLSPNAPSKAAQVDGYDTVAAIGRHLTQFLTERGVVVLESYEALAAHLQSHTTTPPADAETQVS